MRIETMTLSWFRGAAEHAVLDAGSKSVVVYGANGSGKSTFADALEYLVQGGKIEHLKHEYSGSRQEKGIRNTHAPPDQATTITVRFQGGDSVRAEITPDGRLSLDSEPAELAATMQAWDLRQLILRQDEVANFVHAVKRDKYSVLLPLLGLDALEEAAENLHQVAQRVRTRSRLEEKEQTLTALSSAAMQHLPDLSDEKVIECLSAFAPAYIDQLPQQAPALAAALAAGIDSKIKSAEPETKRHLLLVQIDGEALVDKLKAVTDAEAVTKEQVDKLLERRIAVLQGTQAFMEAFDGGDDEQVECPACGRPIVAAELAQHVRGELEALERASTVRTAARKARRALAASLKQILDKVAESEVSPWLGLPAQKQCREALTRLAQVDLDRWEEGWSAEDFEAFNSCIAAVAEHVRTAIQLAPPSTLQLIGHQKVVESARSIPEIRALKVETAGVRSIVEALTAGENSVRDAIKTRTRTIIQGISREAQRLWSKLHPDEPIEDIRLYIPGDADKAIDIGLKFYGVDQPSPRLTLSEGHRNSLGLCIFLALVGLDKAEDRPIVLDDIVSSLDREHRGMLVDVLLEDLGDRQVLLFTHDREWFAELRARLPSAGWRFVALRPWERPDVGLEWSASTDTFDDARALIAVKPEAAGNRVRAIMDAALAVAAEKLIISMPYLRGDRNDHRTSVDFLERIIADAADRLRKKDGESWIRYPDPIRDWEEARGLLISWANRASHTGSLTATEVHRLIEACERALSHFRCSTCNDPIWIADQATRERKQCNCGEIQWRYD